jgi:hypothetical protein
MADAPYETVTDMLKTWLDRVAVGVDYTTSISDSERSLWDALPTESYSDAKHRYYQYYGSYNNSVADLERNYLFANSALLSDADTNQDGEYRFAKLMSS